MTPKLYAFKRDNKRTFYVEFKDPLGRVYRRTTGVTFKARTPKKEVDMLRQSAEKKAMEIYTQIIATPENDLQRRRKTLTLREYFEQMYLPQHKNKCRAATVERTLLVMDDYISFCGNKPMHSYTYNDITRYINYIMDEKEWSPCTANISIRIIKTVFKKAVRFDVIQRTPYEGQDMMFKVEQMRRAFTSDELEKLFKVSEGHVGHWIFKLAYHTGMRIGELSALTWSMVDMRGRSILLPAAITKARKRREIPLNNTSIKALEELHKIHLQKRIKFKTYYADKPIAQCSVLQKERGWGQFIDRGIGDVFRKARTKAGLSKELKFHCLRHSTATDLIKKGVAVDKVSKILGHSTIVVTMMFYDHTTALTFRDEMRLLD